MPEAGRASKLILCVDDDPGTRVLLKDALDGCDVLTAASGHAALKLARKCPVDLYLVSAWLPDLSAGDLCGSLRRFDRRTPIISYAPEARDGERDFMLRLGARQHLVQPLDTGSLSHLIECAIRDSWIESMTARIAEHAAVLEEMRVRSAAVGIRSSDLWRDSERVRNRLLRIRAYKAFTDAGGCRANFSRIWPGMADAFRVGER